eukprot:TRINITY_DN940_c0_g1_i1.p1 TRINITY_DN940_c0_g1~~TRINITY_DN940_c0_g1_i1.p1  ORF type:complete len:654 (+),score=65.91 TRINITY_DN940_c0_g1_i1:62-2023(+)
MVALNSHPVCYVIMLIMFAFNTTARNQKELTVGLIYIEPLEGWTFTTVFEEMRDVVTQHFLSNKQLRVKFITYVTNNDQYISLANQICDDQIVDIIIPASAGSISRYLQDVNCTKILFLKKADLIKGSSNLVSFWPMFYQLRYVHGMLCGMMPDVNKIGFILHSNVRPQLIVDINSAMLGARSVNADVEFSLSLSNSNINQLMLRESARKLIADGADCIIATTKHDIVFETVTEESDIPIIFLLLKPDYLIHKNLLTTNYLRLDHIVIKTIEEYASSNNVKSEHYYIGLEYIRASSWSSIVPFPVIDVIEQHMDEIIDGSRAIFDCQNRTDLMIKMGLCQNSSEVLVDPYNLQLELGSDINFNISLDAIIEEVYYHSYSLIGILYYIFIVASILISLYFIYCLYNYKDTTEFRVSSPNFGYIILIGCIIGISGCFFVLDRPSDFKCNMNIWLIAIGFVVTYSNFIGKNYRVYYLYWRDMDSKAILKDRTILLGWFLPCLVVELFILTVWLIYDPSVPVSVNSVELSDYQVYVHCKYSQLFMTINFGYFGLLLLLSLILSVKSVKIQMFEANEAKEISFSGYNTILIGMVGVLLHKIVERYNYLAIFNGISIALIFDALQLVIFLPKLAKARNFYDWEVTDYSSNSVDNLLSFE